MGDRLLLSCRACFSFSYVSSSLNDNELLLLLRRLFLSIDDAFASVRTTLFFKSLMMILLLWNQAVVNGFGWKFPQ